MTTIANYWELQGGKPSVDDMLAKMRDKEDAVTGTLLARIDPEIARLVVGLKAASQQARRYLAETAEERGELALKLAAADLECRKAKAALAVATTYGGRYKLAMALLADVELSLWAYLEDLKEEGDRTTYESISALHDRVVLCLGKESPES